MVADELKLVQFANRSKQDRELLKRFVDFHWQLYKDEPQFIPLLDYEYLGFKLLGITGFFEPSNLFFKHAEMTFFLAMKGDQVVGRCNAFINHNHNKRWNDKVGFFGQFECIDDQKVADLLMEASCRWLKEKGMDAIRGPQNLPVNEATPGILVEGFDKRPVIYYHYNKPYYEKLIRNTGFDVIKRVKSWEGPVMTPMEDKLQRVGEKVIKHFGVTFETWGERPSKERKREMFEIYNEAWNDNFGFVPFTREEFYKNIDDMQLIMEKGLFLFVYVKGELAGFFGGVPNIFEKMAPLKWCRRCELLRAAKMLLTKGGVKGFRLGYMGVKPKFRRLGLDGVMLYRQKIYSQKHGYIYADLGWILEDNFMVTRIIDMMQGFELSKVYAIMQKNI
ncbi:hypothetical protein JXO59_16785 [candidate division KSB1 bacterium]|nr:hypothetical protein [candidate division KSB1 bacterium]